MTWKKKKKRIQRLLLRGEYRSCLLTHSQNEASSQTLQQNGSNNNHHRGVTLLITAAVFTGVLMTFAEKNITDISNKKFNPNCS